jgi:hypothetical protein
VAFFVRFTSNTRAVQRSNNFLRNEMRNAFPFLALVLDTFEKLSSVGQANQQFYKKTCIVKHQTI